MQQSEAITKSVIDYIRAQLERLSNDLLNEPNDTSAESIIASHLANCAYLAFSRKESTLSQSHSVKTAIGKYLHHKLKNEQLELTKRWGKYIIRGTPDMLFAGHPVEIKLRREIRDMHNNIPAFNQSAIYAYLAKKKYGYIVLVSRYNTHSIRDNIRVYRVYPDYYKVEERIRTYIEIMEKKKPPMYESHPLCTQCRFNDTHEKNQVLPKLYFFELAPEEELLTFIKYIASRIVLSEYTKLFCSRFHELLGYMKEGRFDEFPELAPYVPKIFVKTNTYGMLIEYGLYDSFVNGHVLHTVILDAFPYRPFPSTLLDMEYAMKKYSRAGILVYVKSSAPLDISPPEKTIRMYIYSRPPEIAPIYRSKAYSCVACPFKQICKKLSEKIQ
ncbi:MAG: hypothetical protein QXL15_01460 [Candidatus Korarchaeota archaeon]